LFGERLGESCSDSEAVDGKVNGFKIGEGCGHFAARPKEINEVLQNVMAEMEKSPKFFRLTLIKVVEEDAGGSLHCVFAALHSGSCKVLLAALVFSSPWRCPYNRAAEELRKA